jgi:hypothetical protein
MGATTKRSVRKAPIKSKASISKSYSSATRRTHKPSKCSFSSNFTTDHDQVAKSSWTREDKARIRAEGRRRALEYAKSLNTNGTSLNGRVLNGSSLVVKPRVAVIRSSFTLTKKKADTKADEKDANELDKAEQDVPIGGFGIGVRGNESFFNKVYSEKERVVDSPSNNLTATAKSNADPHLNEPDTSSANSVANATQPVASPVSSFGSLVRASIGSLYYRLQTLGFDTTNTLTATTAAGDVTPIDTFYDAVESVSCDPPEESYTNVTYVNTDSINNFSITSASLHKHSVSVEEASDDEDDELLQLRSRERNRVPSVGQWMEPRTDYNSPHLKKSFYEFGKVGDVGLSAEDGVGGMSVNGFGMGEGKWNDARCFMKPDP